MPAVLELPPQVATQSLHAQPPLSQPLRPLAPAVGPLTEGLAQVLGRGLPVQPLNAQPSLTSPTSPYTTPEMRPATAPAMPQTGGLPGLSVEAMVQALQQPPTQETASSLETLRMQMFGRYYEELEGRMKELRQVLEGGVTRARKAMLERVDELGAALHRDMVALLMETQKELEDLKRDVFTTVMSVSAINDKMGLAESRNRETWVAVTKALADRIDQQAKASSEAIERFRAGADESLDQRVVRVVESTLMKLASARREHAEQRPAESKAAVA